MEGHVKTVLKIVCPYCNTCMGEKDGQGVTGETSGICQDDLWIEMMLEARRLVKERKISWDEAKRLAGVPRMPILRKRIL
jgi:hypothetical protein